MDTEGGACRGLKFFWAEGGGGVVVLGSSSLRSAKIPACAGVFGLSKWCFIAILRVKIERKR